MKAIPSCPGYFAKEDGSIWSCRNGGKRFWRFRKLKGEPRKEDGRLRYTLLSKSGKYIRKYGSAFVLESFVGPRPDGMEACHNDGNRLDDSVKNLRWDTPDANRQDKFNHGNVLCGDRNGMAKLSDDDVKFIRETGFPLKPLAERFGVTETTISFVLSRKIWKHV